MSKVVARIKVKSKHYEIQVDLDEALKVKAGSGDLLAALDSTSVFYDLKKGTIASNADLKDAYGTTDFHDIAKTIISKGEVQKTQEFRDSEKENKIKQVMELLIRNAVDQHGRPFTEDRLKTAIQQAHYSFDNRTPEQQLTPLVHELKKIIPIKISTKKIKLTIPARFTGQAYGILKDYKESEDWLANGDLQVIMNIPPGILIDFYDRLNSVTHGAAHAEELE